MAATEPQPRVEDVSLSGAMARLEGSLHHGHQPAYPLRHRGARLTSPGQVCKLNHWSFGKILNLYDGIVGGIL